jgi:hypothetical protein
VEYHWGVSYSFAKTHEIDLLITGKGRGLTAKPPAFFFLWLEARTGAVAAYPHARGGAPAVFRRRGAVGKIQLDVLEVVAASVSSGRAPMR